MTKHKEKQKKTGFALLNSVLIAAFFLGGGIIFLLATVGITEMLFLPFFIVNAALGILYGIYRKNGAMKVPVIMVMTQGSFLRDPLYNNLQKRKTKVSAKVSYLLSPEDIAQKSSEELYEILSDAFTYDQFRMQHEHGVIIDEPFRADGLHRVLYKCPSCGMEGDMVGKGIHITCNSCSKEYTLNEDGTLSSSDNKCEFKYVSDWYAWERQQVKKELEEKTYLLDIDVDIKMLVDTKSIYSVGEGRLRHTDKGFELIGCDGKLSYTQSPKASYSLYADYFWYEIGDMICIGDSKAQYYCFPKDQTKAIVAKARLATEELYKMLL